MSRCENYWCNIHKQHAHECECPPVEDWQTDPYTDQRIHVSHRAQGWAEVTPQAHESPGACDGARSNAQNHVLLATARANELIAKHGAYEIPDGANEHDACMQADYTGTRYTYATVPLYEP